MGVKKGDIMTIAYIEKYYYKGIFTRNMLLDIFSNTLVCFTTMKIGL